jgi:hypothetical protein
MNTQKLELDSETLLHHRRNRAPQKDLLQTGHIAPELEHRVQGGDGYLR